MGSDLTIDKWTTEDVTNANENGHSGIKIVNISDGYGALTEEKDIRYEVTYALDGKYDTLTGTLAFDEETKENTKSMDSSEFAATVAIRGDNDEMIYVYAREFENWLHCNEKPVEFSVDVSGQQQITIVFESRVGTKPFAYALMSLTNGLLDLELRKTYESK